MKIGFLGGGNMGGALMQGLVKAQNPAFDAIAVYDPAPATCERLSAMGITPCASARAV